MTRGKSSHLVVRCSKCKSVIAAQAIAGDPTKLGEFLLAHAADDISRSRPGRQVIVAACTCLPSVGPAITDQATAIS